jgi:hypothetical protein
MTAEKPPEDEPGADERFDRAIKNALATPPKPRAKKEGREPKPAPSTNQANEGKSGGK